MSTTNIPHPHRNRATRLPNLLAPFGHSSLARANRRFAFARHRRKPHGVLVSDAGANENTDEVRPSGVQEKGGEDEVRCGIWSR